MEGGAVELSLMDPRHHLKESISLRQIHAYLAHDVPVHLAVEVDYAHGDGLDLLLQLQRGLEPFGQEKVHTLDGGEPLDVLGLHLHQAFLGQSVDDLGYVVAPHAHRVGDALLGGGSGSVRVLEVLMITEDVEKDLLTNDQQRLLPGASRHLRCT